MVDWLRLLKGSNLWLIGFGCSTPPGDGMSIRRFGGKIDGAILDSEQGLLARSGGEGASSILTGAGERANQRHLLRLLWALGAAHPPKGKSPGNEHGHVLVLLMHVDPHRHRLASCQNLFLSIVSRHDSLLGVRVGGSLVAEEIDNPSLGGLSTTIHHSLYHLSPFRTRCSLPVRSKVGSG